MERRDVEKRILTKQERIDRAARLVYSAWVKEGVCPPYHREQKRRLARAWSPLFNAIEGLRDAIESKE
jgi:hypothetical protein